MPNVVPEFLLMATTARDAFEYMYGEAVKLGQARTGMTYEVFSNPVSPRLLGRSLGKT